MSVIFPKWTNHLPTWMAIGALSGLSVASLFVWYYFSPRNTDVGYQPIQPILYSHKLHAGDLGIDCRYCHNTVEVGPHAAVPPTETCMNCHSRVRTDSPEIMKLTAAHEAGLPVRWQKVHLLPDYAYFNHAVHVSAGVGCDSCHGRIDQMEVVRQSEPLNMGWCLECHRNPENHVRPADQVTNLNYTQEVSLDDRLNAARTLIEENQIVPPTHCSACHR